MIRTTLALAATALALAACSPQKTPEQLAAERNAEALKEMVGALGGVTGADAAAQMDPQKLAAAMAQAGAIASAMDNDMTPEQRAKMQAITGAMASGQVHPAASAYLAGANKAFDLLGNVKTAADVNAVAPQVNAIFAEMTPSAATLKGMPDDQRDVAIGSAMPQMIGMSTRAMKLMTRLASDSDTMEAVSKLLDKMPQMD